MNKRKSITKKVAIQLAKKLFASSEIDAYDKARDAYDKARDAYDKAWDAYDKAWDACALTTGHEIIVVLDEYRAFNISASDYNGVYCYNLRRHELWHYDGVTCPCAEAVEKIELNKKQENINAI